MSPERLRQIEELFHAVREGSAERQAALLARADPELRREVESLLGRQSENLFLDRAAVEASAQFPKEIGRIAAEKAYDHLAGKRVDKELKVPVKLICKDNAAEFSGN